MTEKLTITGPADLIAIVPHLLGNQPKESFVVLTARGNTLGATLRMDAPAAAVKPLTTCMATRPMRPRGWRSAAAMTRVLPAGPEPWLRSPPR